MSTPAIAAAVAGLLLTTMPGVAAAVETERHTAAWHPNTLHRPFNLSDFDTIYVQHMRKAGGSTVRNFLQQVAGHCHKSFAVVEGPAFNASRVRRDTLGEPTKGNGHPHSHPKGPRRSLLVTHLREPVHRAWSSFRFEGEWPQVLGHEAETNKRYPNMSRSVDTPCPGPRGKLCAAQSVDEWINVTCPDSQGRPRPRKYWQCSCECYHKWLGAQQQAAEDGRHTPDLKVVTQASHAAAKATLDSFHLVLVMEMLHLPEYRRWVLDLLQPEGNRLPDYLWMNLRNLKRKDYDPSHPDYVAAADHNPHAHLRSTRDESFAATPRARKRMETYVQTPEPPPAVRRKLEALNRGDILLYSYAHQALLGTDELGTGTSTAVSSSKAPNIIF